MKGGITPGKRIRSSRGPALEHGGFTANVPNLEEIKEEELK